MQIVDDDNIQIGMFGNWISVMRLFSTESNPKSPQQWQTIRYE